MIASVSPEADRELTEGALFYAREGNAEVALAHHRRKPGYWTARK
jgi:hypothetical protein